MVVLLLRCVVGMALVSMAPAVLVGMAGAVELILSLEAGAPVLEVVRRPVVLPHYWALVQVLVLGLLGSV